jgi:hypothetical protein
MIKALLSFIALFLVFYYGIIGLRFVTKKQAWEWTKVLTISAVCSALSIVVLTTFVILF